MRTTIVPSGGVSTRGRRSRWLTLSGAAVAACLLLGALVPGASPAAADSAPADPTAVTSPETVTADSLPTPQINGVVWDQRVVGDVVYVAGNFSSARPFGSKAGQNETPRANFLAYDLTTGDLLPYAPTFDAQVRSLAVSPDGKRLYAAGHFTKVGDQARYRVAAFDLPSGSLVAGFKPYVNASLSVVQATNDAVYVGGNIATAAPRSGASAPKFERTNAAGFEPEDGAVLPWAPRMVDGWVNSMILSPGGDKIVLGGAFTSINGSSNPGHVMGAVDTASGKNLPWAISSILPQRPITENYDLSIYDLSSDGEFVYGVMGPANFEGVFKARWSDGALSWLADCHGDSYSVVPVGDVVYTASHAHDCGNLYGFGDYVEPKKWYRALAFTTEATQTTRTEDGGYRNYAGQPAPTMLDWYPAFNTGKTTGQGPWDVTAAQGYVLYGGEFSHVNDKGQQGLSRFAAADTAPNKVGPSLKGAEMRPTASDFGGTYAKLSWPTNYDWDNANLTYQVIRDGNVSKPVFTTTQTSRFWQRGTLRGVDGPLTPGTTFTYQIRTVDPFGNATMSDPVSYTATGTAAPSLWTPYDKTVLQDQPELYFPMNETTGTTAHDWVGGDALSVLGARTDGVETDAAGRAYALDGVTGYAATNGGEDRQVYSTELWFKTTTTRGGVLMAMGSNRATGGANERHVYMDDAGRIWWANWNGVLNAVSSPTSYNDGGWHHVVTTLGPNGMALYVDGVLVGSRSDTTSVYVYGGASYWFVGGQVISGRPNNPTSSRFQGAIDNVAVYARALDPTTVEAHHAAGAGTPNEEPTAAFEAEAVGLAVDVDASASTDPDGRIASYAWDFGDGATADGVTASHTFATAGTYTVAVTVTDDRGATSTALKPVTVATTPEPEPEPEPEPSGVIAQDSFERSVASGWGSATTGGPWTTARGSTASVRDGAGTLTGVKGQTSRVSLTGASAESSDTTATFVIDTPPTGGGQAVMFTGRQVGADSYTARIWAQSNGVLQLQLQRSGKSLSLLNLTNVAYVPGEPVHVRFQVTGTGTTTLAAKVWTTGAEPADWARTTTDSTAALQAAGSVGIGLYVSSSAAATGTVSIDDYRVTTVP